MRVTLRDLSKQFGQTTALREVSLTIEPHELFFLLGPSGCGKTTLLRLIAGFYQPDGGDLRFGERSMSGVPPHQRNTGMVFQNYALWPHMTVADNIAYGLEVRGLRAAERRERVRDALEIVQMQEYASRLPNQLSGGQQQRVALARALVIRPDVLLLDEPLSNLDAKLRLELREEIRRIHAQTRITTIYVTHDQKEALSLATRMAVMRGGIIEQVGDPRAIYRAPANRFVADFIGETNWLTAEVSASTAERLQLQTEFGRFESRSFGGLATGAKVWLGFRPETVKLGVNGTNSLDAKLTQVTYLGDVEQYSLELRSNTVIKAIEQNPDSPRLLGTTMKCHVRPEDCLVLPRTD